MGVLIRPSFEDYINNTEYYQWYMKATHRQAVLVTIAMGTFALGAVAVLITLLLK